LITIQNLPEELEYKTFYQLLTNTADILTVFSVMSSKLRVYNFSDDFFFSHTKLKETFSLKINIFDKLRV